MLKTRQMSLDDALSESLPDSGALELASLEKALREAGINDAASLGSALDRGELRQRCRAAGQKAVSAFTVALLKQHLTRIGLCHEGPASAPVRSHLDVQVEESSRGHGCDHEGAGEGAPNDQVQEQAEQRAEAQEQGRETIGEEEVKEEEEVEDKSEEEGERRNEEDEKEETKMDHESEEANEQRLVDQQEEQQEAQQEKQEEEEEAQTAGDGALAAAGYEEAARVAEAEVPWVGAQGRAACHDEAVVGDCAVVEVAVDSEARHVWARDASGLWKVRPGLAPKNSESTPCQWVSHRGAV